MKKLRSIYKSDMFHAVLYKNVQPAGDLGVPVPAVAAVCQRRGGSPSGKRPALRWGRPCWAGVGELPAAGRGARALFGQAKGLGEARGQRKRHATHSMADFADEKIVSFDELSSEEKAMCSMLQPDRGRADDRHRHRRQHPVRGPPMQDATKRLVVGVLAHVDSGKDHPVRSGAVPRRGYPPPGPCGPPGRLSGHRQPGAGPGHHPFFPSRPCSSWTGAAPRWPGWTPPATWTFRPRPSARWGCWITRCWSSAGPDGVQSHTETLVGPAAAQPGAHLPFCK